MPGNYVTPSNKPTDPLMTALGHWGNMENLLLVKKDINWVEGQLFSLNNPIATDKLKKYTTKILAGNKNSAIKIESVLKYVFSAFNYMNDATAKIVERKTLNAITQETTNIYNNMLELKSIKAIFNEFMPAYRAAVLKKAQMFVLIVSNYVTFTVGTGAPTPMPAYLAQLIYTCFYYAKKVNNLRWQDLLGF